MKIKYYYTLSGRSPIEDFLDMMSREVLEDFYEAVDLLEKGKTLEMPVSRSLSNIHQGLHELRLKDRHGIYRLFYYIKKHDAIYFLHGFQKKTQTIPKKEVVTILNRLKELKHALEDN
jgi:phage-related protein